VSLVEEAVADLSNDHWLETVDIQEKRRGRPCRLESGLEASLVAGLCNYIWQHLATNGAEPPFNQFFYIPSTRAEKKVGYDLSIGHYPSEFRIRTMHKVLLSNWCDETWEWLVSSSVNARDRHSPDYRHLTTLLRSYSDNPNLVPILVVNVCYCLHEYRRMGATYEGYRIPSIDSLLRTAIIPLFAVPGQIPGWQDIVESPDFKLTVSKAAPGRLDGEMAGEYLARIAAKDQFEITVEPCNIHLSGCVLTLDELCDRIRQGFELEPLPRT
jgi:hypothetical protein